MTIHVEKHIIKKQHALYQECVDLSFKTKNIYNYGLYLVNQHFHKTGKYLGKSALYYLIKNSHCYNQLPKKVGGKVLSLIDQNYKSFFALLKLKKKENTKNIIRTPRYLKKKNGRCIVTYQNDAIYIKHFKETGELQLSKTNIFIKTQIKDWDKIRQVRIIPRNNQYVIEVIYIADNKKITLDGSKVASIDIGMNNLVTMVYNFDNQPLIINGKPLKSINQYYNKKSAKLQRENAPRRKHSPQLVTLTNKRNNKINDYIHKSSRYIVNQLVSLKVQTLIIGKNKGMKQDINIGRRNNQNFVCIPHAKLISMIKYKAEQYGIIVHLNEESYTSKCSFFDNEPITKHKKGEYKGRRISRGMFKTNGGRIINADVNAAYNIMKKGMVGLSTINDMVCDENNSNLKKIAEAIPNFDLLCNVNYNTFKDGIEGLSVVPIKLRTVSSYRGGLVPTI
jgi:putative transposase